MLLSMLATMTLAPTLLIAGGTVYDGTGKAGRALDIRISGDRIVAMGALKPLDSDRVISAAGMAVAPGFIDAHSHAAGSIDSDPTALSQLTQGITTAVVGQDGGGDSPWKTESARILALKPSINFATFTGHGDLRKRVMGEGYKRVATDLEISKMEELLAVELRSGTLGLSSGLEYDPGYYSDTKELIRLAKVVKREGGLYISHVRDEADKAFEAFKELVQIGKEAKIPAQISHIKLGTVAVWGRAGDALKLLKGNITADVYPYLYWQSTIAALSPSRDWENREIWVKGLADVGGPQNVRLTNYTDNPEWVGKNLAEIATMTGRDAVSIIQEILRKTNGIEGARQSVVVTAMQESDLEKFLAHPRIMFCSDGSIGGSHPRGAGSFPRILGRCVRERKVLPLAEAIRKMTSLTAKTFGLKDRGILAKGKIADVVIFDPKTITDHATPEKPRELSTGIETVIVGGQIALSGKNASRGAGRILSNR
jgi:N-acyl-D-amino-acid deacylase